MMKAAALSEYRSKTASEVGGMARRNRSYLQGDMSVSDQTEMQWIIIVELRILSG